MKVSEDHIHMVVTGLQKTNFYIQWYGFNSNKKIINIK
jgi:hypothetical protein